MQKAIDFIEALLVTYRADIQDRIDKIDGYTLENNRELDLEQGRLQGVEFALSLLKKDIFNV